MEKQAPKLAAIDCGTNSFHLIIVSVDHRGILNVHYREKESVRLGCCAKDMKYLKPDAVERALNTLKRFVLLANAEKAQITAVATSAVREAENKDDFIKKVKEEVAIDIEVISGSEEGRLIYTGVIHALPIEHKKTLVIDIGGGSTETIIGYNGEMQYVHSEKIGAIRLTQGFFPDGVSTEESVKNCRDYIKGVWAPTMQRLIETGFEIVVGTSGTIINIAIITLARKNQTLPNEINGLQVNREDLLETIELIVNTSNMEERAKIPGMDPNRVDIILSGALIIEHAIKSLNIQNILISSYALREGIIYNSIEKDKAWIEKHQLNYLRYTTIQNMCKRYNVLYPHAEHVKNLSLKIFDDLKIIHGLGDKEREWLEAAALLHDIGFYISAEQHHKHSYYLISQCDMPGFTKDEAEIIAQIARYHRKSLPKKKHASFWKLSDYRKNVIMILGGILRIAEGIDRRQMRVVKDIETKIELKDVEISLIPNDPEISPDIEIWGANRRKELLEKALNITINFKIVEI